MAFRLYVGNYPSTFTKDGVQNIFRDFEGVKVDKYFSPSDQDKKSFSFIQCTDIEQVLSVIKKMNGAMVARRALVVRAADKSLQQYVDLILSSEGSSSNKSQFMRNERSSPEKTHFLKDEESSSESQSVQSQVMRNKCHPRYNKIDSKESNMSVKSRVNAHCDEKVPAREANARFAENNSASSKVKYNRDNKNHEVNDYEEHTSLSPKEQSKVNELPGGSSKSYQAKNTDSDIHAQKYQKHHYPKYDRNHHHHFQKSYENSFGHHDDTDIHAQTFQNESAECLDQQQDESSPTWVSVSNFRFGTSFKKFYDLFSDYEPLKVFIICNEYRPDKTLTEAHVCFPNRDIADDVILNFDNTMFEGRVILVNDVEDSTVLEVLTNMSRSYHKY